MSYPFARTLIFASALLSAASVVPYAAEVEKAPKGTPDPKGKFQLSLSEVAPPELEVEIQKLNRTQELFKKALVTNDEVMLQNSVVENLRRRVRLLLTLRSEGGSLGELLDEVSSNRRSGFSLTVINVGDPSDLQAKLPAFTLQRVHWGTAIDVLSKLLISQGLELSYSGGDSSSEVESSSVICVLRRVSPPVRFGEASQPAFEAFGLSEYIYGSQTLDTITEAIQTAWAMDPNRARNISAVQLKFHPGTKILFVSGPEPAGVIARQVIAALSKKKPIL